MKLFNFSEATELFKCLPNFISEFLQENLPPTLIMTSEIFSFATIESISLTLFKKKKIVCYSLYSFLKKQKNLAKNVK